MTSELFVDLTDESREDGARSISVYETGKSLRRIDVSRLPDGGALLSIANRAGRGSEASIELSGEALGKLVRGLVRLGFVPEDWNNSDRLTGDAFFSEIKGGPE